MTSPSPHTAVRAESRRAVQTNGEGKETTAHLNLTVTMRAWMEAELEPIRQASPQFYARHYSGGSNG